MDRTKTVAIIQSSYIPWRGYFDIIRRCDEFILLDDIQYSKNGWRNRNRIITAQGPIWLTIPVLMNHRFGQLISETQVVDHRWCHKHWKSLVTNYRRAPFFCENSGWVEELFKKCESEKFLSRINFEFLTGICNYLGINTEIKFSNEFKLIAGKNERLIHMLKQAGATHYITGPNARYLDVPRFNENGIEILFADYGGYPPYQQVFGKFVPDVSILDVIFNLGPTAIQAVRGDDRPWQPIKNMMRTAS